MAATSGNKKPRLKLYSAYKFGRDDKDPIIDVVHTALDDSGLNYSQASSLSGVSSSAIYNWIEGDTKRPQFCTIMALMGALGKEIVWRDTDAAAAARRKRARTATAAVAAG